LFSEGEIVQEQKKSVKVLLTVLGGVVFWFLNSCISKPPTSDPALYRQTKSADQVSIMSFNVENLFDLKKESGKNDQTYLPLSEKKKLGIENLCANDFRKEECMTIDWDESALTSKFKRLTQVVMGVEAGKGPDILVLPEVENIDVLKEWNTKYLSQAGYGTQVLLEGEDPRGIDVGLLSRFPLAAPAELIAIPNLKTRSILKVPLRFPDGNTVVVYGVHLPSQANPVSQRKEILEILKGAIVKDGRPFLVAGDFNITTTEESNEKLLEKTVGYIAEISHFVGCQSCQGTHYYRHSWSFLDIILVSKSLKNKTSYHLLPESIEVVKEASHVSKQGTPIRFNYQTRQGTSDHFPLYLKISKGDPSEGLSQKQ
jgi:endonuclease/exonuclease/phosphatase family metal-dependent hydrolase